MPLKRELTWQQGKGNRQGRWKKKYRGKTVYLGTARCKSDLNAYRRALATWEQKRLEIDAELASQRKPHQEQYEAVIHEWELVLRWSVDHDDDQHAALAREKLAELRARLERKRPPPVTSNDRLWSRFTFPQEALDAINSAVADTGAIAESAAECDSRDVIRPDELGHAGLFDGSPLQIATEVWRDRLAHQAGDEVAPEKSLDANLSRYLADEQARVEAGRLSAGRFTSKRNNLHHFRDWIGGQIDVEEIKSSRLLDYRNVLLDLIGKGNLAHDTAHGRLNDVKSFVRWLWRIEALPDCPRILDSRELCIQRRLTTPEVFTLAEVKTILKEANDRTRLYLLLMLNCGFYQGDVSNLRNDEVDWRRGIIKRKRSKTQNHDRVPVVEYQLWGETFRLLKNHRSEDGDLALLNRNGSPLVRRDIGEDGTAKTNDAIKNAHDRLKKKTGVEKPLKLLRKTSASLLSGNERFSGLVDLFLGLAPSKISDRHYAQAPQSLLDEAVAWLGEKFEIESISQK